MSKIFETRNTEPVARGLRITVTMESTSNEGLEWALAQAIGFARARMMGVTCSHKDDPSTRVSCRTTRLRKRNRMTPPPPDTQLRGEQL